MGALFVKRVQDMARDSWYGNANSKNYRSAASKQTVHHAIFGCFFRPACRVMSTQTKQQNIPRPDIGLKYNDMI